MLTELVAVMPRPAATDSGSRGRTPCVIYLPDLHKYGFPYTRGWRLPLPEAGPFAAWLGIEAYASVLASSCRMYALVATVNPRKSGVLRRPRI